MEYKTSNKERKKVIKTIIQAFILILLFIIMIRALFVFDRYVPYDKNDKSIVTGEDKGFIAISYLAVDRDGTSTMISTQRLKEHLKALYDNGYVSITQQDIENYYKNGTKLPEKAVFLMFEDGRRDTAIFAQSIMEQYNFIGTILNYAEKFETKDSKFLMPKDILNLQDSTFWELGSNGYRLSYINVFDRYDNYLGELTSVEYSKLHKYLERNYNQYLMDFIRDEYDIPKETANEMRERISGDYKLMKKIYTEEFGKVPDTYVLMHANTGSFANNDKVSAVNEEWMKKLFQMNFNREGYSLNNAENDIYDLTRMQPQPYWYANHLLMRIADDTNQDVEFVLGDEKRSKDWKVLKGASEFLNSTIALTSESEGSGLIRLENKSDYENLNLTVDLKGNILGTQTIYMRADKELKKYVSVKIQNNSLFIEENGKQIFKLDLRDFDNQPKQSIEENKKEALENEYKIYSKYTNLFGKTTKMEKQEKPETDAKTVAEGADEYIPTYQINELGNRRVNIILNADKITVNIDNKTAIKDLALSSSSKGYIYLESAWAKYGYSQRNIADDVYDGVFEDLVITDIVEKKDNNIYYDNRLKGWDKIKNDVDTRWDKVVNWFIETL
jgi:hypothetical protein